MVGLFICEQHMVNSPRVVDALCKCFETLECKKIVCKIDSTYWIDYVVERFGRMDDSVKRALVLMRWVSLGNDTTKLIECLELCASYWPNECAVLALRMLPKSRFLLLRCQCCSGYTGSIELPNFDEILLHDPNITKCLEGTDMCDRAMLKKLALHIRHTVCLYTVIKSWISEDDLWNKFDALELFYIINEPEWMDLLVPCLEWQPTRANTQIRTIALLVINSYSEPFSESVLNPIVSSCINDCWSPNNRLLATAICVKIRHKSLEVQQAIAQRMDDTHEPIRKLAATCV